MPSRSGDGLPTAKKMLCDSGIVRRRHPHRAAAALPRVAVLRHRSLLGGDVALQILTLARLLGEVAFPSLVGERVERPRQLAVILVVRLHEAANAVLGARASHDDEVVDDERCDRQAVASLGIGDFDIPLHGARLRVERNETRIERSHEHGVAGDRDAAIVRTAAVNRRGDARLVLVAPDLLAGARVDRHRRVVRRRHVHHAIDDRRTGLERAEARDPGLVHPGHPERADVRGRDLREWRVALVGVVAAIDRPVAAVAAGVLEHRIRDVRERRLTHGRLLGIRFYLLLRSNRSREHEPTNDESHSTIHAHSRTSGKHVG